MQLNIFSNDLKRDASTDCIPGLLYREEFINPDEALQLWTNIDCQPWLTDIKRRVQHYGWKYDYKARTINYSMYLGPLPEWVQFVANRLIEKSILSKIPDQLIVNEYQPGQGITNHVDCEPCFGDTIVSLSLGCPVIMDLINLQTKKKVEFVLQPRSIIAIAGESRYKWSHGIAARKTDLINNMKVDRNRRISLTFRNVIIK